MCRSRDETLNIVNKVPGNLQTSVWILCSGFAGSMRFTSLEQFLKEQNDAYYGTLPNSKTLGKAAYQQSHAILGLF